MNPVSEKAIKEFKDILDENRVVTNREELSKLEQNTLGIKRNVPLILIPENSEELRKIILAANSYNIPMHPSSTFKNDGYGNALGATDWLTVLNMSRFNEVPIQPNEFVEHPVELKNEGYVHVGTGVTQKQLFDFLKGSGWMMDVTGAGEKAGVVANTLAGGFGHTPLGNRRKEIEGLQAILGNGDPFYGGTFPSTRADLNQLFVQGNLGITTSLKIPLMRIPESIESYLITMPNEEGLEPMFETVSKLRQDGTLTSLVHIGDPVRLLVTGKLPEHLINGDYISSDLASKLVSSQFKQIPIVGGNIFWTALGALYGSKGQVKAKKADIKEAVHKIKGKVEFFDDKRIDRLESLGGVIEKYGCIKKISNIGGVIKSYMNSVRGLHQWPSGIPTSLAEENIGWRVNNYNNMGLIWVSPTFGTNSKNARYIYDTAKKKFNQYGFDAPLTMTLVEPNRIVGILNIHFDKSKPEEIKKAHELYKNISLEFASKGIYPYRMSILGMQMNLPLANSNNIPFLKTIKKGFDPNNIISPGLYGI